MNRKALTMNEVIQFLNENPVQYFATVGLDGRPKVRPFQFMLSKMANYTSAQIIQKKFIKKCKILLM